MPKETQRVVMHLAITMSSNTKLVKSFLKELRRIIVISKVYKIQQQVLIYYQKLLQIIV